MSGFSKITILLVATILLLFLLPGKFNSRSFDSVCDEYCKDIGNDPVKILECNQPLDGYSALCVGFVKELSCEKTNKCFSTCSNVCFGLVFGTGAAPNSLDAKLNFIMNQ